MKDEKICKTRAFAVSKSATVFQAEINAIRKTIPFVKDTIQPGEIIHFMCDSQAAIHTLESIDTRSEMVLKTKDLLNSLGERTHL